MEVQEGRGGRGARPAGGGDVTQERSGPSDRAEGAGTGAGGCRLRAGGAALLSPLCPGHPDRSSGLSLSSKGAFAHGRYARGVQSPGGFGEAIPPCSRGALSPPWYLNHHPNLQTGGAVLPEGTPGRWPEPPPLLLAVGDPGRGRGAQPAKLNVAGPPAPAPRHWAAVGEEGQVQSPACR